MDTQNKAKWVHRQEFRLNDTQGGVFHVSEKGAIKVCLFNQNGTEDMLFCTTERVARRMIENALINIPLLGEYLESNEYRDLVNNKRAVKEQAKLQRQVERAKTLELNKLQAHIERLKTLGIEVKVG